LKRSRRDIIKEEILSVLHQKYGPVLDVHHVTSAAPVLFLHLKEKGLIDGIDFAAFIDSITQGWLIGSMMNDSNH
jgi:hypothetical protein